MGFKLAIYKITTQEMCQDFQKNLSISLFLLQYFGFLVCFAWS